MGAGSAIGQSGSNGSMPPTLAEYTAQKQQKAQQDYANGIMTPQNTALDPWSGTTDANGTYIANTPEQAAAAYAQLYNQGNQGNGNFADIYNPTGSLSQPGTQSGYSGPAGTGGLSSLVSQQPTYSNAQPTTNALQSFIGSNTNPYANTTSPYFGAAQAQTLGNLAGAQTATQANRVNQNTPYASLNYIQSTDASGNPVWTANQSLNGPLGGALNNLSQNVANTAANPFNTNATQNQLLNASSPQFQQAGQAQQAQGVGSAPSLQTQVGGTGTQGWDAATQMIMNRLQPQMTQSAESNTAALANQGIVPGTQAYNNAMRTFQQGQNDLLTSAQMQGANLQNQLFNQNVTAGQFGNTALQNQNSMNSSNTQLGNQAAQQNYTNQLAGLGLNNQYAQQGYSNAVTGQQANNAALQNNYSQNLAAYNNPLQQLGAFQSGTQPSYINAPQQAAVAGPDYMGALGTQTNANIAAQNAALGQQTNQTAGLYGLGSAGILGLAANPGLVSSGLSGIGSGISSAYNWLNTPSIQPSSAVTYANQLGDPGNALGI